MLTSAGEVLIRETQIFWDDMKHQNLRVITDRNGQSDATQVWRRYGHLYPGSSKQAATALGRYLTAEGSACGIYAGCGRAARRSRTDKTLQIRGGPYRTLRKPTAYSRAAERRVMHVRQSRPRFLERGVCGSYFDA